MWRDRRCPCRPGSAEQAAIIWAINIYWHYRVKTAAIFAACYPWLFFGVAFAGLSGNSSASGSNSSQASAYLVGLLFLVALSFPFPVPGLSCGAPYRTSHGARQGLGRSGASCWEDQQEGKVDREGAFARLVTDPLGTRRKELAKIAEHLCRHGQSAGCTAGTWFFPPSDLHTLAGGFSRSIHQFLGGKESLQASVPDDLRETLVMTLALLSVRRDPDLYHRLAQRVAAFDSDGLPAVELTENPPGWISILAARTLATIPRITVAVIGMAAIAAIIIASILTILHRMNLEELLRYLR